MKLGHGLETKKKTNLCTKRNETFKLIEQEKVKLIINRNFD